MKNVSQDAIQQKEQMEPGVWYNRGVPFCHDYALDEKYKPAVHGLLLKLGFSTRKENLVSFEVLIANLLHHKRRKPIIAPLSINKWKKGRYFTAGKNTTKMIHKLYNQGYIDMKKGHDFQPEPREARIWATDKLLQYCPVFPDSSYFKPVEVVKLKDKNKKLKDYKDTAKTRRIRSILKMTNKVNEQADIRYKKLNLSPYLVAVFTEKFTLYGRLHTSGSSRHYQSYSEDERMEFTINGEPVIELDFSGLHPHLLYAKEGIQFFGDPYTMIDERASKENEDLRNFYKEALLSQINARGKWIPEKPNPGQKQSWQTAKTSALKAINGLMNLDNFLPEEKEKKGLEITKNDEKDMDQARKARKYLQEGGFYKAQDIIDAFKRAHPKIAHYFYAGETGMRLMNKDAQIALDVIQHFAKQGIPVLAVHDSFLVQKKYHDELMHTMKSTYRKHTGFRIPVK